MTRDISKKGLYVGIGAGLVLFILSGLLSGSFIGGSIGVHLAMSLLGGSIESSLLPRLIVGVCMFSGILISGMLLLIFSSSLGWLSGYFLGSLADAVRSASTAEAVKH
jgi:hypothetical protein